MRRKRSLVCLKLDSLIVSHTTGERSVNPAPIYRLFTEVPRRER